MSKLSWSLVLVASMAAIASFFPIAKYLGGSVHPLLLTFFRFSIAAVFLAPLMAYRHSLRLPPREDWPLFLLLAFLAVIPTMLVVIGIGYTNTIVSAILMNTQALIIALIAPLIIGEKVATRSRSWLALGFIGVALIVVNGRNPLEDAGSLYVVGTLILLLGALSGGLNKLLSKQVVRKYDGLYATFFPVALGSGMLAIALTASGGFAPVSDFPLLTFVALAAIGIVCTAIPWLIWTSSLKHLDVHVAVSFNLLIPIFATIYSLILFDEMFTVWMALGMLLTSISIYFVNKRTPEPVGRPLV